MSNEKLYHSVLKVVEGTKYKEDHDKSLIAIDFSLEDVPLQNITMFHYIYDTGLAIEILFRGIKVVESARNACFELLSRINHNLRFGFFNFDKDGNMYFRIITPTEINGTVDPDMIHVLQSIAGAMVKRFCVAIVPVMLGVETDIDKVYMAVAG